MRNAGWGAGLDTRPRLEEPLGGQIPGYKKFFYVHQKTKYSERYVSATLRVDFYKGMRIVSACRRTWLSRWLERHWGGLICYAGKRDLLEIHVRK